MKIPHRCPVCEGRGMVPWDPANPYSTTTSSCGPWLCPTCHGARLVFTDDTENALVQTVPATPPINPAIQFLPQPLTGDRPAWLDMPRAISGYDSWQQ